MASHRLAISWIRLNRAKEYTDAFKARIADATDPNKHPVRLDRKMELEPLLTRDGKRLYKVSFAISDLPEFTSDDALLLGDALHGFRSSLDYLAWSLVRLKGHKGLSAKGRKEIQFPMAKSRAVYWDQVLKRRGSRLPGVPREPYLNIIERYQPYHRSDAGRTIRALRTLSDIDKHRFIIPTFGFVSGMFMNMEFVGCNAIGRPTFHTDLTFTPSGKRRLKQVRLGTEFASVSIVANADAEPDVRLTGHIGVVPIVAPAPRVWDTPGTWLDLIGATCSRILEEVEAEL
jgi:hypothetical protein